jgi:hypothetical protein
MVRLPTIKRISVVLLALVVMTALLVPLSFAQTSEGDEQAPPDVTTVDEIQQGDQLSVDVVTGQTMDEVAVEPTATPTWTRPTPGPQPTPLRRSWIRLWDRSIRQSGPRSTVQFWTSRERDSRASLQL